MSFRVVIEAEAEWELAEAVAYYDGGRPGMGQEFVRDVFRRVCENPERYPRHRRLTRKAKVLDWPYSVYFAIKVETREVVIITVWHGSRNPAELRRRLR
jgi:plasmid stabilization system protein ParE